MLLLRPSKLSLPDFGLELSTSFVLYRVKRSLSLCKFPGKLCSSFVSSFTPRPLSRALSNIRLITLLYCRPLKLQIATSRASGATMKTFLCVDGGTVAIPEYKIFGFFSIVTTANSAHHDVRISNTVSFPWYVTAMFDSLERSRFWGIIG